MDLELYKRRPKGEGKCRWFREEAPRTIQFTTKSNQKVEYHSKGSSQMPDVLLKHVPKQNSKKLNSKSYQRWLFLQTKNEDAKTISN